MSLQPQHAARLLAAVCAQTTLRRLTLTGLRGCAAAAAEHLPAAKHLRHLGLLNWRMTGDQMAVLAPEVAGLPALTSLHVCGNYLSEMGARALADVMHARGATLRDLVLVDNCMGADAAAARLAAGVCAGAALTRLSLSGNRFTAAGVGAIAAALRGCSAEPVAAVHVHGPKGLRELVVRQEWREPEGVAALARAVQGLPCIEEVDVRGCGGCGVTRGGGGGLPELTMQVVDNVRAMKPGMLFKM